MQVLGFVFLVFGVWDWIGLDSKEEWDGGKYLKYALFIKSAKLIWPSIVRNNEIVLPPTTIPIFVIPLFLNCAR